MPVNISFFDLTNGFDPQKVSKKMEPQETNRHWKPENDHWYDNIPI